jgi:hypothetical protein
MVPDKKIIGFALREVDHHLLSDLYFARQLHAFLNDELTLNDYLHGESGFRRFLYDYRVGRTLQAGDKAKVSMLKLIRSFPFTDSHVADITALATAFQKKRMSTISINGRYGFPQSFASKLMSVYRPDGVIPYDSYALKSIEAIRGIKVKSLAQYYDAIDEFRRHYFAHGSRETRRIKLNDEKEVRYLVDMLNLDMDKMLSLKLTDKYLWCMEAEQRRR